MGDAAAWPTYGKAVPLCVCGCAGPWDGDIPPLRHLGLSGLPSPPEDRCSPVENKNPLSNNDRYRKGPSTLRPYDKIKPFCTTKKGGGQSSLFLVGRRCRPSLPGIRLSVTGEGGSTAVPDQESLQYSERHPCPISFVKSLLLVANAQRCVIPEETHSHTITPAPSFTAQVGKQSPRSSTWLC